MKVRMNGDTYEGDARDILRAMRRSMNPGPSFDQWMLRVAFDFAKAKGIALDTSSPAKFLRSMIIFGLVELVGRKP